MDIGKVVKVVTVTEAPIPIKLPRPEEKPIYAPDWPVKQPEPAEVGRRDK